MLINNGIDISIIMGKKAIIGPSDLNEDIGFSSSLADLVYEDMRYDINLTVVDYDDGSSIEGAEVTLAGETKTTDSDGLVTYEKVGVVDSTFDYTVEHPDYETTEGWRITVYGDDSIDKSISTQSYLHIEKLWDGKVEESSSIDLPNFDIEYEEVV